MTIAESSGEFRCQDIEVNTPSSTRSAPTRSTTISALIMASFLLIAGVAHFVVPAKFDDIVPTWLPFGTRFWTLISGAAELSIALGLFYPRTRARAAWAALGLFVAVYPANIYMAWEWRDRSISEQLVAYGRLPLQFLLFWWAVTIARQAKK